MRNHIGPSCSPGASIWKGRGGLKAAIKEVMRAFDENEFVFRTDVRSYYESVDHGILLDDLSYVYAGCARETLPTTPDVIMSHMGQWLRRIVETDGIYEEKRKGLPTASSLSPLMGGFYLRRLDERSEKLPVFYIRYMDDILMMSEKRHQLRKGVRAARREFESLKLAIHPDKTFIGRKERDSTFSDTDLVLTERFLFRKKLWQIFWLKSGKLRHRSRRKHGKGGSGNTRSVGSGGQKPV